MDIKTPEGAKLHEQLSAVIGEEASWTLMAHLPDQPPDQMATKADIERLGADLRARIDRCATKDDLKFFVTKDDAETFATKADLERFATKADLERFATKADLAQLPSKSDLADVREFVTTEISAVRRDMATAGEMAELRQDVREIRTEVISLSGDVQKALVQGERLRAEWREDLVTYIGRQTVVQLGTLVTIIVAALAFVAYTTT